MTSTRPVPVSSTQVPTPAGAYTQVMMVSGFVYTSGFGPQHPTTGEVPDGIVAQTRQVIRNLEAALVSAGSDLEHVLKTTVHLASLKDWAEFDAAYGKAMPLPHPARTTVGSELASILVEIDAVATLSEPVKA